MASSNEPAERPRLWIALLAILLAFSFLGSRGLWDPDEGRYTNVALQMLDSGDWVTPHRNDDVGHWTKPPLTYWAIAGSVSVFGRNTWAARLPSTLSYLVCIALAWRCARRLRPGSENMAALVYATLLMPSIAGQLVTTDYLLAATQTLAVLGFIEWRFGPASGNIRWLWLMWAAYAAAFLTKGPPALLPMLVTMIFSWLVPSDRPRQWGHMIGGFFLFFALVLPWFFLVLQQNTGLLDYFLHAEVVDRVASNRFSRHGEWYGWLEIYLPTLLVGTLPWTVAIGAWLRDLPASIKGWTSRHVRQREAGPLFIALWIAIPLLVFCFARSRLPLYLLPLFVPIAVAIAKARADSGKSIPGKEWIIAWALVLVGFRIAAAGYPSSSDASEWARQIEQRAAGKITEVVFVEDAPKYGLRLYLDVEVETLSINPARQAEFNPEFDETLRQELEESGQKTGDIFVAKAKDWSQVAKKIEKFGFRAVPLGEPYQKRIIFNVLPSAGTPEQPAAADQRGGQVAKDGG